MRKVELGEYTWFLQALLLFHTPALFLMMVAISLFPSLGDPSFSPYILFLVLCSFSLIPYWLQGRFARACSRAEQAMKFPTQWITELLVVRTAADEASAALIACQIGAWLLHRLLKLLLLPALAVQQLREKFNKPNIVLKLTFITLLYLYLDLIINALYMLAPSLGPWWWNPLRYFNSVLSFLMLPVTSIVLLALTVGPLMMSFLLGIKLALGYIYLDVAVEAAQSGHPTIYQFGLRSDLKGRIETWLNHSITCQAEEIVAAITAWIKTAATKSSQPRATLAIVTFDDTQTERNRVGKWVNLWGKESYLMSQINPTMVR